MLNASEAYKLAKHSGIINEIKKQISKQIEEAVNDGKFTCEFLIGSGTEDTVRDEIVKWLHMYDYKVTMPKYKSQSGCPADQMNYHDTVKISWQQ